MMAVQQPDKQADWPEVVFDVSPVKFWLLTLLSGAFVLFGLGILGIVNLGFEPAQPWSKSWTGSWMVLVLFGLVLLKLARQYGAVVTIGPRGVHDTRLAEAWIPWNAITDVMVARGGGQPHLMLQIDPALESQIPFRPFARFNRVANGVFGYRGYSMSAIELRGGFHALKQALDHGLARSRNG